MTTSGPEASVPWRWIVDACETIVPTSWQRFGWRTAKQGVRAFTRWLLANTPRTSVPPLVRNQPPGVCLMTRGIVALQFIDDGRTVALTCGRCGSDVLFTRDERLPAETTLRCVCRAHLLVRERGRIEGTPQVLDSTMYIVRLLDPRHPLPRYGDEVYIDGQLHWWGPSARHAGSAWFNSQGERTR